MSNIHRQIRTLLLRTAVMTAMTVCWVAGCAKKSGREAVPEARDTLTVISDTLSKTHDTLSVIRDTLLVTHDTLSEIPNTLTDKRDGKTYKTVKIGKQTWMAENLNYETESSWCYHNYPFNCDEYGRLYDWKTAMAGATSSSANPSGVRGVCPSGWHLPSRAEWDALGGFVGDSKLVNWTRGTGYYWPGAGTKLKSTSGWHNSGNGTNESGFSALPGGGRIYSGGGFDNADRYGYWWTSTELSDGYAYYRYMFYYADLLYELDNGKDKGFSVRCVDDRSAAGASSQKSVGDDRVGIEMVFVKGGTFMMGCTGEQGSDCDNNEKPAHSVAVGDFYIGKYEVTQNQWIRVMGNGNNPSYFKGGNLPAEQVSWNDALEFILRLNTITEKKYRLPTEAEWEYAARGGASSKGYKYSGRNIVNYAAWYNVNSGDKVLRDGLFEEYGNKGDFDGYREILSSNNNRTRAVGTKASNELGIHDMSGNVYEWVNDWYGEYGSAAQTNPKGPLSGSYRVIRGGGWGIDVRYCRVSFRNYIAPDGRDNNLGFRLALSP